MSRFAALVRIGNTAFRRNNGQMRTFTSGFDTLDFEKKQQEQIEQRQKNQQDLQKTLNDILGNEYIGEIGAVLEKTFPERLVKYTATLGTNKDSDKLELMAKLTLGQVETFQDNGEIKGVQIQPKYAHELIQQQKDIVGEHTKNLNQSQSPVDVLSR